MTPEVASLKARLNYVELPVTDAGRSAAFFEAAFGWSMTAFGPSYAATTDGGAGDGSTDLGLQGDTSEATAAPLAVIQVDDLDATLAAVEAAGASITRAPFDYPGGRRFHFREPGGCELAVNLVRD